MNIYELEKCKMSCALAYALGLIFPLYKVKPLEGKEYILGSINHNSGKITQDEINQHYEKVFKLFKEDLGNEKIQINANKTNYYNLTNKEGFSILIEKLNVSKEDCVNILTEKTNEIKNSTEKIKAEFVKGCFDGRSSWDKTAHYLSIDVDRDYNKQDIIIEIIESVGIDINNNRRDINHEKNDQLRIKYESLPTFMSKIGFYSSCRNSIVKHAMNELER
ncbi:MAG: hypothetical protein RR071_08775 [Lachnospiraceae bacterium]